jgi:hypothetical protein
LTQTKGAFHCEREKYKEPPASSREKEKRKNYLPKLSPGPISFH